MAGIRINKLCNYFGVGKEALVAFLSSNGIMASSNPNFKVPESVVPLLQKEYGYKENTEASARSSEESLPVESVPKETKTVPTKSLVMPDSPYRNGNTGKYKLLIKSVTEKFGNYEYLLVDAEGKEYKTVYELLFTVGDILRCIVTFKVENAKLLVESAAICKKQDLAKPIPKVPKPTPSSTIHEHQSENQSTAKPKQKKSKSKHKTKSVTQPEVKSQSTKLGHPQVTMISGEYKLKVYDRVRGKALIGANYRYLLEDADEFSYFALSNLFFEIGSILACDVKVKESTDSKEIKVLREVSILYKAKRGPKRKKTEKKNGSGKGRKRNSGYTQYDWAGTPYTGGFHIIYTRM